MRPRSTCWLVMAASLCAAAMPAVPLRSADFPAPPSADSEPAPAGDEAGYARNLPALLAALRSPDYRTREDATTALLRYPAEARSDIEHAISEEADPEALNRLMTIALHLFLKDPRLTPMDGRASLLGITLGIEPLHPDDAADDHKTAIVVMDTKPGFPAYEVLKPGDRIIAVDDQPLLDYSFDAFKSRVNTRVPGSLMNVTVRRDGKTFKTAVRLAGLRMAGEAFLVQFVEQRNRDGAAYLERLQAGLNTHPLVVKDNTPPEINIYNDEEVELVP